MGWQTIAKTKGTGASVKIVPGNGKAKIVVILCAEVMRRMEWEVGQRVRLMMGTGQERGLIRLALDEGGYKLSSVSTGAGTASLSATVPGSFRQSRAVPVEWTKRFGSADAEYLEIRLPSSDSTARGILE